VKVRAIRDSCQHGGVRPIGFFTPLHRSCDPLPTDRAERETRMKSNAIGVMKKGEKGLRPSGDRPVELSIFFVCNKVLTPGWAM
jgi:hypothetical protein